MDIKTGLVLCNAEDTRDRKPALIFGAGNQNRLSEHASYENDYDFQLRLEYIRFIPRSTLNKELRLCFLILLLFFSTKEKIRYLVSHVCFWRLGSGKCSSDLKIGAGFQCQCHLHSASHERPNVLGVEVRVADMVRETVP